MPATRHKPALLLASVALGLTAAPGATAVPAAAEETSYCGIPEIDEINVNETTWAEYSSREQSDYYDAAVERLNALTRLQEHLGMSREDFCTAVKGVIYDQGEAVVAGALRGVMVGDTGLIRDYLFEDALIDATHEVTENALPDRIPAVGGGEVGVTVSDSYTDGGGTDGSPSPSPIWGQQDGAYWYDNGLGLAVECYTAGPSYNVQMGETVEQWSTYFRVTDGMYVKSAATQETTSDSDTFGLPAC